MDQAPVVLAGHWIEIPAPEKALIVGVLQILDLRRIFFKCDEIKLNRARILLPAIDQRLFLLALALEDDPRHLLIQHQRDRRRQHEHDEHGEAALPGLRPRLHPASSSISFNVCWLLFARSSMSTEFSSIR